MIYKINIAKTKRKAETKKSFKAKKARRKKKKEKKVIKNIVSKRPIYDLMMADIIKKL